MKTKMNFLMVTFLPKGWGSILIKINSFLDVHNTEHQTLFFRSTSCTKCKNDFFTSKPGQATCSRCKYYSSTLSVYSMHGTSILPKGDCGERGLIFFLMDKSNEKLRPPLPPFQRWKNVMFCFALEFIIDFGGGGGGLISIFILSKIVERWYHFSLTWCILLKCSLDLTPLLC